MKKQPKHLLYAHLDDAGLRDLIKELIAILGLRNFKIDFQQKHKRGPIKS